VLSGPVPWPAWHVSQSVALRPPCWAVVRKPRQGWQGVTVSFCSLGLYVPVQVQQQQAQQQQH
jgi:hypothetical protein